MRFLPPLVWAGIYNPPPQTGVLLAVAALDKAGLLRELAEALSAALPRQELVGGGRSFQLGGWGRGLRADCCRLGTQLCSFPWPGHNIEAEAAPTPTLTCVCACWTHTHTHTHRWRG